MECVVAIIKGVCHCAKKESTRGKVYLSNLVFIKREGECT